MQLNITEMCLLASAVHLPTCSKLRTAELIYTEFDTEKICWPIPVFVEVGQQ
jgi:hypothetical protein